MVLGCLPDCPGPGRNRYFIWVARRHGVEVSDTLDGNVAAAPRIVSDAAGQSVTLVDGDTAYAAVRSLFAGYGGGNLAGAVTGGLYSYHNSAHGQIQPDGTVTLAYQGTPVWLFTAPLIQHVNDSVVPLTPGNSPWPTPNYTGCSYVAIVDAASGSLLTNWQNCTSS